MTTMVPDARRTPESGVELSQSIHDKVRLFTVTQAGSDASTAFTVARERDLWGDREDLALKGAFVIANRPKGVSAEHFLRWLHEVIENPLEPDVPEHHLAVVREAAATMMEPHAPALAIECSWSETTTYLWQHEHEIKRGKRRPQAYRFVGAVRA